MIQGGGFTEDMDQKSTQAAIKNEADNGLKNVRGSVGIARSSDPHSATTQFYLNLCDNDFLNFTAPTVQGWGYCVFGRVVSGLEVMDKIAAVKTGTKGHHRDVPVETVLIEKVLFA
ncbi:hypothetical protein BGZ72_008707 [Mortierella alpina]|nr:hypothetical protein BGZ72_008707 [Mortierella alpina]